MKIYPKTKFFHVELNNYMELYENYKNIKKGLAKTRIRIKCRTPTWDRIAEKTCLLALISRNNS